MRVPSYHLSWGGGRSLYELNENAAFNNYDTRMHVSAVWRWGRGVFLHYEKPWYDFSLFEERALYNVITNYLPGHVNYQSSEAYITASWKDWFHPNKGAFESWFGSAELPNGLPDIVETLIMDPSLKLLTVHGYYDAATPFYRTELSLKGVEIDPVKKTTLLDRIPVKNFEGGHMIYYSEKARAPLKKTLGEFYDAPPYGTGPTIVKARDLVAAVPVQRAPVPAVALH